MDQHKNLTLATGVFMPFVGLGTWNAALHGVGEAVRYAIEESGYRHIDCAAVYHNEKEIGKSLKEIFGRGTVSRGDVFIVSKLWCTNHARKNVAAACKSTLQDLDIDYLDLYLMHFGIAIRPGGDDEPLDEHGYVLTEKVSVRETWEAMEELVYDGLIRAIGVANFTAPMLLDLLSYAKIPPAVNQIELHPYLQQERLIEFCHHNHIAVTAYSPLGNPGGSKKGGPVLLEDKTIREIAVRRQKTPAQILIRWALERNTIAIPKSVRPERIRSNIDVFDFVLSPEEMQAIQGLERKHRFVNPADWWRVPYFD